VIIECEGGALLPAPILTVTVNPALDKTIIVENFALAKVNRSQLVGHEPGGKGINVAKNLRKLNNSVITTGFIAGKEGNLIKKILACQGTETDFIEVPGDTRVNLKIIDPVNANETEINEPGFKVTPENISALKDKLFDLLPKCALMVLSGSLPPGAPYTLYGELINIGHRFGVKTILDAEGEALEQGLLAKPLLVKPNKYEAELLLHEQIETPQTAAAAGMRILKRGPSVVIISLGSLGAISVTNEEALWAKPPKVHVESTVGAGDAMVAVLAKCICEGTSIRNALPLAVAAGTHLAIHRGKSFIYEELEILAGRVEVMPIAF
jgi:1-phosphofructokinase